MTEQEGISVKNKKEELDVFKELDELSIIAYTVCGVR